MDANKNILVFYLLRNFSEDREMGEYIQMKKFVKKIIVLMLAFAMSLSIAPSSVQAATSKKEKKKKIIIRRRKPISCQPIMLG